MQIPAEFVYQGRPARVIFGAGSIRHLQREVLALGVRRVLVLCTPTRRDPAQAIADGLGDRAAGVFDGASMHVPLEVAEEARKMGRSLGADCALAFGGGSTIGLGKAMALDSGIPVIAIPTTYAGSEMTPIYGITEAGHKRTGTDLRVLPRTVIYDLELTVGLPVELSLASGMNAIAHAAEGMYAQDGNPVMGLMAEESIRSLALALPRIQINAADLVARGLAQYGAWLAGMVLGSVGMALHHKLCHTLGGSCNLPHAAVHTVVLPHVLAYNASAAPEAMRRIARALGTPAAALGVYRLAQGNGGPGSLRQLGMQADDVKRVAQIASANPYWNPRPLGTEALQAILQDAYDGVAPREWPG